MTGFLLNTFGQFISNPLAIASMICCALGIALICSARNFARAFKKDREVNSNNRVFIFWAFLGVLLLCVGVIMIFLINNFSL